MTNSPRTHLAVAASRIVAAATVALTLIGAWRAYSGIPYWDMWDGYIGFYRSATDGSLSVWWEQHNEHRLFLSRPFFYADLRWFGGRSLLPLAANLLALGGLWLLLAQLWRRSHPADMDENTVRAVAWTIGVGCFSWIQHDNITVAFQLPFFLACLLPLATFAALAAYSRRSDRPWLFWSAAILGVLSSGTMANGIAVPLLLCLFAAFLRLRPWQIGVLAVLGFAVPAVYLTGYVGPAAHGAPMQTWIQMPAKAVWFVCVFLGNSFAQLGLGTGVAGLAGLGMIALLAATGVRQLRRAHAHPSTAALVVFLAYLVLSGLATASGRTVFGLGMALATRYATVSVLALTTVFLLALTVARDLRIRRIVMAAGAALCIGNLAVQAQALQDASWRIFPMRLGMLALSLDVNDPATLEALYPDPARLRAIAAEARTRRLSLFDAWPYDLGRAAVGAPAQALASEDCGALIERTTPLDDRTRRVEGRLPPQAAGAASAVWLIDADDRIAGLALAGNPRLVAADARQIADNGFIGYTLDAHEAVRAVCARKP